MSPKTNIIILIIVAIIALAAIGYGYWHYTQGIEQVTQGIIDNKMGLPYLQTDIKLESENIRLFYPEPPFEFKAGTSLEVIGQARVFEGNVEAELTYSDGEIIDFQFTTAQAKEIGEFGSFNFIFQLPAQGEIDNRVIKLEIFSTSAKDGSRENQVYFPLAIID